MNINDQTYKNKYYKYKTKYIMLNGGHLYDKFISAIKQQCYDYINEFKKEYIYAYEYINKIKELIDSQFYIIQYIGDENVRDVKIEEYKKLYETYIRLSKDDN